MCRKLSAILFLFCVLFNDLNAQVNIKDEGLDQQIHSKVERINLKDFGIERRRRIEDRQLPSRPNDNNRPKIDSRPNYPYDRRGDIDLNKDRDLLNRNWRDSRSRPENTSPYSRRELRTENDRSSPLDWTSSPRRIGVAPVRDFNTRRAFNFSSTGSSQLAQNIPKRNCSEVCVAKKYLQHYRVKGCQPIMDYECNCAMNFDCAPAPAKNTTFCQFEGRVYQIGSRIPVRNPCRICECRDFGRRRGEPLAEIDCGIGIECPESAFGVRPEPGCYFAYKHDQCCGTQVCANTLVPKREEKVCTYKGRTYKKGQKIYPEEDSCKMCLCSDDWDDNNPLGTGACKTYSCELELNKEFQNGCLPIYHEGTCCPIEYKCPKNTQISTLQRSDRNNCVFDGRKYPIGSRLTNENVCVDCVCKTPPDFTCVHKSCPSPSANCYVGKWDHSVCCQNYICSRPDHIRDESQFRNNFYSNNRN